MITGLKDQLVFEVVNKQIIIKSIIITQNKVNSSCKTVFYNLFYLCKKLNTCSLFVHTFFFYFQKLLNIKKSVGHGRGYLGGGVKIVF